MCFRKDAKKVLCALLQIQLQNRDYFNYNI
ncbi:hypothetical protein JTE90_003496 [Oedothorax gibbosus]|uniref:Uncharacterized protein n=1 Tax=Oedothorax gibbosus TaxID=931172 RepID=A0AAV6TM85_9ARAC|nr:hypothetical protein JTE90_003496 [Oedothorax gibbosus]